MIVGIDASRNRSGGARAHLVGILSQSSPIEHGIEAVHVWAYRALLDAIPDQPWLVKHNPPDLEKSLLSQVWWQRFRFPDELVAARCSIVLNTDAGTVSSLRPAVTMSRDMISYEPGEIERYGVSKARLRLILLRYIQNRSLRHADGAIFLTRHAAETIQKSCGRLSRIAYIPHGVGDNFRTRRPRPAWPSANERPVRCLYVSNAAPYKHQWVVVRAVEALRRKGYPIVLSLVGGGSGKAQQRLEAQIFASDPKREFVTQLSFVAQDELPEHLAAADLFVFASSCENMPNTLVEAMASGLPIACSDRGPMPEMLKNGGVYFDPENSDSIAAAIERIVTDVALRVTVAARAKALSEQYSWPRCATETWSFIADIHRSHHR